jgi:hypothetical protein
LVAIGIVKRTDVGKWGLKSRRQWRIYSLDHGCHNDKVE